MTRALTPGTLTLSARVAEIRRAHPQEFAWVGGPGPGSPNGVHWLDDSSQYDSRLSHSYVVTQLPPSATVVFTVATLALVPMRWSPGWREGRSIASRWRIDMCTRTARTDRGTAWTARKTAGICWWERSARSPGWRSRMMIVRPDT